MMSFKDTQDYERYTCLTGGRPDDKLPPLDFQVRGRFLISFLRTKPINTEWICPPRPWRGLVPMARGYQRDPVRLRKSCPQSIVLTPKANKSRMGTMTSDPYANTMNESMAQHSAKSIPPKEKGIKE